MRRRQASYASGRARAAAAAAEEEDEDGGEEEEEEEEEEELDREELTRDLARARRRGPLWLKFQILYLIWRPAHIEIYFYTACNRRTGSP